MITSVSQFGEGKVQSVGGAFWLNKNGRLEYTSRTCSYVCTLPFGKTSRLLTPVIYEHKHLKLVRISSVCHRDILASPQAPAQANAASFPLTLILAKRGDTEKELRIAHAYFTGYSLICLLRNHAGGYGGPYKCFWLGWKLRQTWSSKSFLFIETIKFSTYWRTRPKKEGIFNQRGHLTKQADCWPIIALNYWKILEESI